VIRKGVSTVSGEVSADIVCLRRQAERGQFETITRLPRILEFRRKRVIRAPDFSKQDPVRSQRFPLEFAKRFSFADELHATAPRRPGHERNSRILRRDGLYAERKDDLSRLRCDSSTGDPAFLAYCKQLEKQPVIFCGTNVRIDSIWPNPKPNRARRLHG